MIGRSGENVTDCNCHSVTPSPTHDPAGRCHMYRWLALLISLAITAGGCAQYGGRSAVAPPPLSDPRSLLTLEQVPPATAALPEPRATTQPDAPAPVEALALFAAARDAMIDSRPVEAIAWLTKAM